MVVEKDVFIDDFCNYIRRMLKQELPERTPEGEPFFEDIYIKTAKIVVCQKLLHLEHRLDK